MDNLQHILTALRNCDDDHISNHTIARAREELKSLLGCDDFDLNELLKQFIEVETTITFIGAG